MSMPAWRRKHPCVRCGSGYGACFSGYVVNMQCCAGCDHPSRWEPDPYTKEDYEEMHKEADRKT